MEVLKYLQPTLFEGKTVFVTGGGSGINLGIARHFSVLGANVAICGRTEERLRLAAEDLISGGGKVMTAVADVRDIDTLSAAMSRCREELGPIDVLVCGAAGNFLCPAERLSAKGFKSVIDIDLLGSFNACRAAFDQLRERRGCVLFISAGQSFIPFANQVHAGAAKAGIDNLMRNLALEWGRFGIRSNSIAPGFIAETEGTARLSSSRSLADMASATPLGRLGSTEDIGCMAVLLASPLSSYVTGTVVVVDGGCYLRGAAVLDAGLSTMHPGPDPAQR